MTGLIMQSIDRIGLPGLCRDLEDGMLPTVVSLVSMICEIGPFTVVVWGNGLVKQGHNSIRRSVCRPLTRCEPPSPMEGLASSRMKRSEVALPYHFERVELLFDLLSEHRGKTIACSYLATAIIFPRWPGFMKFDA